MPRYTEVLSFANKTSIDEQTLYNRNSSYFFNSHATAQVSGVSGSKLTAFNAQTIHENHLEMEPSFTWMSSRSAFNDKGSRYFYSPDKDSLVVDRALLFRATYSPFRNLEIGGFFAADMSSLSVGMKYMLWERNKSAVAILAGINWCGEYRHLWNSCLVPGEDARVVGFASGLAFTTSFSDKFSWDTDIQYQKSIAGGKFFLNDYMIKAEAGYYILNNKLQLIGGVSYHYQQSAVSDIYAYSMVLNPGVIIETGKSYTIVIYAPFTLFGKSIPSYRGINMAFTIDIN